MAENQEIIAAKERLIALRAQIAQETSEHNAAAAASANDARLASLTDEERHLEQQLAEIRSRAVPGADPNAPVVQSPAGTTQVDALRLAASSVPEGTDGTIETVDAFGNLVRTPISEVPDEPEAETDLSLSAAPDTGTMEADAPPPPGVPDDATMTSRAPRT